MEDIEEKYKDNFETSEDIKSNLELKVKLYVYSDTREFNVNGKWQHSEPTKAWFDINEIFYFRDQTENDKYNPNCLWIMDSTVMPTKYCMMVYHDDFENAQKIIPVVGTAKELNKMLDMLKDKYYKRRDMLHKLKNKIKELYLMEG